MFKIKHRLMINQIVKFFKSFYLIKKFIKKSIIILIKAPNLI